MGGSMAWSLVVGVVLLGDALSAPFAHPNPAYDSRLSTLELAIIKCIVETVPGVTKGGGGSYDWSVVQSRSKELEGADIEVVQVGQREPDYTGRSGEGYPGDLSIVRSVSRQLASGGAGAAEGQGDGGEGLSDDWGIVRSISTELHLDAEEAPSEPAQQPPVEQTGRGNFQGGEMVVFPGKSQISSGEDSSGSFGNVPIDIRTQPIDVRSFGNVMDVEEVHMREYHHGGENVQQRFGDGESAHQTSGEQNNEGGGAIGWSIVRSISSEQEPISEEVSSSGSQQPSTISETQAVKGDTDSYGVVVQPISTELQPADNEAGGYPASLTEMFPPGVDETGASWNSPPSSGVQPSEVHSLAIDEPSSSMVAQEPCETGHKRIKNVCRKVYSFQLKSHLR